MDVRGRLSRWALARPHVLLVTADAGTELRWHVEAELVRRRWPQVGTPADADLLLTAGGLGDLSTAVDVLWAQVPPPRHRVHVDGDSDVRPALDAAVAALLEPSAVALATSTRPADDDSGDEVAGLPMAGGAPDRDGLELDTVTVHVGPVLPGWPPGLVVRAAVQGDVLTDVHADVVGPTATRPPDPLLHALDVLERVLLVSGWVSAAREASRLRADLWQAERPTEELTRAGRALVSRIRGSRTLRWALRDLRGTDGRVLRCCAVTDAGLAGDDTDAALDELSLNDIGSLLDGLDVGSARLVVASLPVRLGTRAPAARA